MKNKHHTIGRFRLLAFPGLCRMLGGIFVLLALGACSSIDCPLNNRVYTSYQLRTPDGSVDTLSNVLMTVSTNRTDGSDSVLINRDTRLTVFSLPISNAQPRDSFFVELADAEGAARLSLDTIVVSKDDRMHFESTDCAPSYFHSITAVTTTRHAVDSVVINNKTVNYDTSKPHFYIYFAPRP